LEWLSRLQGKRRDEVPEKSGCNEMKEAEVGWKSVLLFACKCPLLGICAPYVKSGEMTGDEKVSQKGHDRPDMVKWF
jgi:hypothetical protein